MSMKPWWNDAKAENLNYSEKETICYLHSERPATTCQIHGTTKYEPQ